MDSPPSGRPPHGSSPAPPPVPGGPPARVEEIGNRTYLIADVEPLDVTGIRTILVGTLLFLLAGLALLPFHGWLEEHDRTWWLWTCVAGFGLGLFGFDHCRRRARRLGEKLPLEDRLRRSR